MSDHDISYKYGAVLIVIALGILRLITTLIIRSRSPLASVPGPWYTKYTTIVLVYKGLSAKRVAYVEALHQKYGKVVRISPYEVDFSSIHGAKRIHSYKAPFMKSEMYSGVARANISQTVFSTRDAAYHAQRRRLLSGPMSETGLKHLEYVVQERATLAVQKIGEEMKKRGAADVLKWWLFMATDVIGELTFGDSFRMLEQGKQNQYSKDIGQVFFVAEQRDGMATVLRISRFFPFLFPSIGQAPGAMKRMKTYAKESIACYDRLLAANPHHKPTLFTKFFHAGDESLSQEEIVAQAVGYLIAGTDTTAQSLTYLIWTVCRHEEVKKKLVEELATLEETYTNEQLKGLPYLNQIIKEILRLHPAAPAGLPREVPAGGCEVDGWWMPGGTLVCTQAHSLHRDPIIFPDPEKFDPLRWENATKEMKDSMMPFGGGARVCLGLNLAYMELRHATAKFFRAYPNAKVSNLEGFTDLDMEKIMYFLISPKGKRCLIQAS